MNIVEVINCEWLKNSPYFAIDMELCDINLDRYILEGGVTDRKDRFCVMWPFLFEQNPFEWMRMVNIWRIAENIASGLAHIHSLNLVHRDLKPANSFFLLVLVQTNNVVLFSMKDAVWKISDFGLSSEGSSRRMFGTDDRGGTACYRGPELLKDEGEYNNKTDIWAFGCVLYEISMKRKAFKTDWEVGLYYLSKDALSIQLDSFISVENRTHLTRIIREMLAVDNLQRPSATDLLSLFSFFGSGLRDISLGGSLRNIVCGSDVDSQSTFGHFLTRFKVPSLSLGTPLDNTYDLPDRLQKSYDHASICGILSCDGAVTVLAICDELVATATEKSSVISLWEVNGRPRFALHGHTGLPTALSLNAATVVSGGQDCQIIGWHSNTGLVKFLFEADYVTALAISNDGNFLAYGNKGGEVSLLSEYLNETKETRGKGSWNSCQHLSDSQRHRSSVRTLRFNLTGKKMLSSGFDDVFVWCLDERCVSQVLRGYEWHGEYGTDLFVSQWLVQVSSPTDPEKIRIWNATTGIFLQTVQLGVCEAAWNYTPCGGYKISRSADASIMILEANTRKVLHTLTHPSTHQRLIAKINGARHPKKQTRIRGEGNNMTRMRAKARCERCRKWRAKVLRPAGRISLILVRVQGSR